GRAEERAGATKERAREQRTKREGARKKPRRVRTARHNRGWPPFSVTHKFGSRANESVAGGRLLSLTMPHALTPWNLRHSRRQQLPQASFFGIATGVLRTCDQ